MHQAAVVEDAVSHRKSRRRLNAYLGNLAPLRAHAFYKPYTVFLLTDMDSHDCHLCEGSRRYKRIVLLEPERRADHLVSYLSMFCQAYMRGSPEMPQSHFRGMHSRHGRPFVTGPRLSAVIQQRRQRRPDTVGQAHQVSELRG